MPWMRSTRAAASDSWSTRMTGTTPATAPSKRSCTPCSRAHAHSSSPCWESSCLLADTTWRPPRIAATTYSRAGSMPPITSTIRSEPSRISRKSLRERVRVPESAGRMPVIASIAPARSASSSAKAPPTVPDPSRPMRNSDVSGMQVLVGLATHRQARLAAAAEHARRGRDAVVVVGHRVPVGTGHRDDEHVAAAGTGQPRVAHQHVAGLAVLADDLAEIVLARAVGERRLVGGAVEHRAQVVGHPAVDGDDLLADGAGLDRLDA